MGSAMNAQNLRERNTSLVLKTILSTATPMSRADIAASTGLTRATVSRLVEDLIALDVIEEQHYSTPTSGRPSTPLAPRQFTYFTVALEVSNSSVSMLVMDLAGNIVFSTTELGNFRQSKPQKALQRLSDMVTTWRPPHGGTVVQTSLVVPGLVNQNETQIVTAPNLGWRGVYPLEFLTLPSYYGSLLLRNEANSAAWAQLLESPGRVGTHETFLYISSEVGIGSATMLDGDLFRGKHRWAGEIGHTCVDPAGPKCGCGANGCLEQYAGQDALFRRAQMPINSTIDELIAKFRDGDATARLAVDEAATSLGRAIANALNLIDVDRVVLGGNLSRLLPCFEQLVSSEVEYRQLRSKWVETEIVADANGERATAIGACRHGFADFIEAPHRYR